MQSESCNHMAVSKQHILDEIRRTAEENDGIALGRNRFEKATGIRSSDWYGKYWARWNDAIIEAGFRPNQLQGKTDDTDALLHLARLAKDLGRFPVAAEIRMRRQTESEFPSHNVFSRFGSKMDLAKRVRDYADTNGMPDVVAICEESLASMDAAVPDTAESIDDTEVSLGFVYLMKAGKHYKIGRTNSLGRREYDLAIQLPDKPNTIHAIKTDDPAGIEAYWHKRFADKRKNGEWFELSAADVRAFRRRKFM